MRYKAVEPQSAIDDDIAAQERLVNVHCIFCTMYVYVYVKHALQAAINDDMAAQGGLINSNTGDTGESLIRV